MITRLALQLLVAEVGLDVDRLAGAMADRNQWAGETMLADQAQRAIREGRLHDAVQWHRVQLRIRMLRTLARYRNGE